MLNHESQHRYVCLKLIYTAIIVSCGAAFVVESNIHADNIQEGAQRALVKGNNITPLIDSFLILDMAFKHFIKVKLDDQNKTEASSSGELEINNVNWVDSSDEELLDDNGPRRGATQAVDQAATDTPSLLYDLLYFSTDMVVLMVVIGLLVIQYNDYNYSVKADKNATSGESDDDKRQEGFSTMLVTHIPILLCAFLYTVRTSDWHVVPRIFHRLRSCKDSSCAEGLRSIRVAPGDNITAQSTDKRIDACSTTSLQSSPSSKNIKHRSPRQRTDETPSGARRQLDMDDSGYPSSTTSSNNGSSSGASSDNDDQYNQDQQGDSESDEHDSANEFGFSVKLSGESAYSFTMT